MTAEAHPPARAFISYVHENSEQVDILCEGLEAAGITIWRDYEELWPGDDWKIKIRRAIQDDSLAFIACFSEESVTRGRSYQNEEITLAVGEYRLRPPDRPWLFPVRFDDVQLPPYELGPGKTLDALQRTDLFGPKRELEQIRLATSILRVLSSQPETNTPKLISDGSRSARKSSSAGDSGDNRSVAAARVKQLLRDESKDIELDDYITDLADSARRQCLDSVKFPTSADEMREAVSEANFVINRVEEYSRIVEPLSEALAVGCAWGNTKQESLWTGAMHTIVNTTPAAGGHSALLDLRVYPSVIAMYGAGLGALARGNYSSLRSVTVDAKHRDNGRNVPVIAMCHPAVAFYSSPFLAYALAAHSTGQTLTSEDLEQISTGRVALGARFTPTSDDLHRRLRIALNPVIRDDATYDDLFDQLEVLFGLIAEDIAIEEKASGRYRHGGWVGRYIWRDRFSTGPFNQEYEEFTRQGSSWGPLSVGLFGSTNERVERAFAAMSEKVDSMAKRIL
jgi:hypothetical protein